MISIVLPVYNGEKYLRESLDSVLKQTVSDWELIIVDDCSTDDSLKIAKEYAAKDSRIQVIHNEKNSKLPHSLNIGFAATKGEYLTWTSDDNHFLPQALEKMRDYLEQHKDIPLMCARMYTIDDDGEKLVSKAFPNAEFPSFDSGSLFSWCSIGACFMYRRCVLEGVGEYDEALFGTEDYDYWLRIYEHYNKIGYIPDFLYEYRYHKKSLTMAQSDMVRKRLYDLRIKHKKFIFEGLRNKPAELTRVIMDMSRVKLFAAEEKKEILSIAPWLKGIHPLQLNEKNIVYGAGDYGNSFAERHPEAVCCFADKNPALHGTKVQGFDVLSLVEAKDKYPKADIVIAGDGVNTYSMIQFLNENGINAYSYCWDF